MNEAGYLLGLVLVACSIDSSGGASSGGGGSSDGSLGTGGGWIDATAPDAMDAESDAHADAIVASCDGGSTLCGAACVDLETDPSHCGNCNKSCAAGDVCDASKCCHPDCSNPNCGSSDGCGGKCHLSDGFCGGGGSCVGGACCIAQGHGCPLSDPYSSTPCCAGLTCQNAGADNYQCQP